MAAIDPRTTRWLAWLAPFVLLGLVLGAQTDWGRALKRPPVADAPVVPAPVATTLLPDFRVDGGVESLKATVERPLFNATRRPAPTALAEAPKPVIQRGQFVLAGTLVTDTVAIAYLRDASGAGKSRSVRVGESVNGMKVAEVKPDRVRLSLGDEFEDLDLKVQKGPKTTIAAAPPTAPGGPAAAPAAQGGAAPVATGAQPAGRPATRVRGSVAQAGAPGTDGAENLRAARRAAREAERAASASGASTPTPAAPQNPWDGVHNRMQNRTR